MYWDIQESYSTYRLRLWRVVFILAFLVLLPWYIQVHPPQSQVAIQSLPSKMAEMIDPEKKPFPMQDDAKRFESSVAAQEGTAVNLVDADEALAFLTTHPNAAQIAIEGKALIDDPVQLKKLVRKIDFTIAPLLAAVYFLQFLDKTTLSYTAVMGIRTDTHLVGQDYSDLSMLFYIGSCDPVLPF